MDYLSKNKPDTTFNREPLEINEIYEGGGETHELPQLSPSSTVDKIHLLKLPGSNFRRCIECIRKTGSRVRRSQHICSKCNQGIHKTCLANHQLKCGIFLVADNIPVKPSYRMYLPSFNRKNGKDEGGFQSITDQIPVKTSSHTYLSSSKKRKCAEGCGSMTNKDTCYYCTFKMWWRRIFIEHMRLNHLGYKRKKDSQLWIDKRTGARSAVASCDRTLVDSDSKRGDDIDQTSDSSDSFTSPVKLEDHQAETKILPHDFHLDELRIGKLEYRNRISNASQGVEKRYREIRRPRRRPSSEWKNLQILETNVTISDEEPCTEQENLIRQEFGDMVVLAGVDSEDDLDIAPNQPGQSATLQSPEPKTMSATYPAPKLRKIRGSRKNRGHSKSKVDD